MMFKNGHLAKSDTALFVMRLHPSNQIPRSLQQPLPSGSPELSYAGVVVSILDSGASTMSLYSILMVRDFTPTSVTRGQAVNDKKNSRVRFRSDNRSRSEIVYDESVRVVRSVKSGLDPT
jgi:hypothetical protein